MQENASFQNIGIWILHHGDLFPLAALLEKRSHPKRCAPIQVPPRIIPIRKRRRHWHNPLMRIVRQRHKTRAPIAQASALALLHNQLLK
jgi:hypothetical protein